jgi:hypothetical protein
MMQTLTEYCAHIVRESRWDRTSDQIRERDVQRETMNTPASWAAMLDRLAAKWSVSKSELLIVRPPPRTPPPRYHETWPPSDPLDGVYWDLREFLRRGQPERWQKCPVCQRYFVQVTARSQTYCDPPCRHKGNATQRERNAAYQREYRALCHKRKIKVLVDQVEEAKKRRRDIGVRELELTWVLQEAGIGKRQWDMLRRWEIEYHGKPRVTALP